MIFYSFRYTRLKKWCPKASFFTNNALLVVNVNITWITQIVWKVQTTKFTAKLAMLRSTLLVEGTNLESLKLPQKVLWMILKVAQNASEKSMKWKEFRQAPMFTINSVWAVKIAQKLWRFKIILMQLPKMEISIVNIVMKTNSESKVSNVFLFQIYSTVNKHVWYLLRLCYITRKYLLCGCILGALTHITWNRHLGGDETLD